MRKLRKIALMAIACAFSMLAITACGKSDKEIVFDAFGSFANVKGFDVAKEMGIKDVLEGLEGKAYEAGFEMVLEDSSIYELSMLKSASVEMTVASEPDEKKAGVELGVGIGGISLVSFEGYFDEEQIAVKVPELIDKVFVLDYSGNIIEKIKKSALVNVMGIDVTELDEVLKVYTEALKNQGGQTEELLEIIEFCEDFEKKTKAYEDFKDAIEVTAIDPEEFEINGKDRKCNGYEIVITTEAIVDFCKEAVDYYMVSEDAQKLWKGYLSSFEGYADMSIDDLIAEYDIFVAEYKASQKEIWASAENMIKDIEIEMFIYEDEIVSLTGEIELAVDNVKVGIPFELVCTGGENSIYENFEFILDLTAFGITDISVVRETESDKNAYETTVEMNCGEYGSFAYNFVYDKKDNEIELSMNMNVDYESAELYVAATLEELKKGKSFELDIDEISVAYNEETLVTLSGNFYVSNDVDVKLPSGDKVDILMTDEEEFMKAMQEIIEAVELLSSIFEYN